MSRRTTQFQGFLQFGTSAKIELLFALLLLYLDLQMDTIYF